MLKMNLMGRIRQINNLNRKEKTILLSTIISTIIITNLCSFLLYKKLKSEITKQEIKAEILIDLATLIKNDPYLKGIRIDDQFIEYLYKESASFYLFRKKINEYLTHSYEKSSEKHFKMLPDILSIDRG